MYDRFHKRLIFRVLAVTLIAATSQYFVPLLNASVAEKCCASQQMQCCQKDFPSRMVCCVAEADKAVDDSVPTQGVVHKSPEIFVLFYSTISATFDAPSFETFEHSSQSTYFLTDDDLYLRLSTFLI